jgi:hypothetical protein
MVDTVTPLSDSEKFKSFAIFGLTLVGAEVALIFGMGVDTWSQLKTLDWPIMSMLAIACTQTIAWLTLSPKKEPVGADK